MSPAVSATLKRRSESRDDEWVRTEHELDELLSVLEDSDCRAVLEATGEEPLSAKEIGERCSIPSSTVYRKVDRLTEARLLEESLRIHRSGKHTSEYSRRVEGVALTIGDNGTELRMETQAGGETPQAAD
jgi:DNA-binding transcriptional ArsR family regulator